MNNDNVHNFWESQHLRTVLPAQPTAQDYVIIKYRTFMLYLYEELCFHNSSLLAGIYSVRKLNYKITKTVDQLHWKTGIFVFKQCCCVLQLNLPLTWIWEDFRDTAVLFSIFYIIFCLRHPAVSKTHPSWLLSLALDYTACSIICCEASTVMTECVCLSVRTKIVKKGRWRTGKKLN